MVRGFSASLAVLAVVQLIALEVIAQGHPAPRQLYPIHLRQYEASFGLQKRATEQFSSLDPQTQSQLIFGSPLENEQLLLANMTLYAPDGLQMILLEEFDDLTTAVDCKGDDGLMSLTFKDQAAFNYALKTWSYINEKEDSKFLVIANHEGCGPDDQRQPYLISKITEDTSTFTTYLTAQPAPWSDVAGTYDMDFGKAIPFTRPNHLQNRGLWGDITGAVSSAVSDVKSGVEDVVNGAKTVASDIESGADDVVNGAKQVASDIGNFVTGNLDLSKSVSFGMNAGTPNQKTQLFTDNTHLTLDCINCYIAGSIEIEGHISVDHFKLQDISLDGTPHGLNGALELGAQITKYEKPDSWKLIKELFSTPVPDAGIEIPGIFKLGAILSYEIGIQAQLQGSATIDFGLGLNVPDTAGIHIDVLDPTSSTAQGFSGDIKPIFDIAALSATLQFSAYASPKLTFGIEITEVGTLDVELAFKSPQLALKFIAAYNETGLCSHEPGASKTGVEIQTQIGMELDFKVDASLGSANNIKPSYWAKLWQDYYQLSSACFPLAIPGLSVPGNTLTGLPTLPSSTTNSSNANFSLLTGSSYSIYTQPPIFTSSLPTAAPLPGNGSRVVVPTGFLRSSLSGVATPTGAFSTNGQASGTGYPYPILPSNASSTILFGSGSSSSQLAYSSGQPMTPPGSSQTSSATYSPSSLGPSSGLPIAPSGNVTTGSGIPPPTYTSSGFTTSRSSSRVPPIPSGKGSGGKKEHHPIATGPLPLPPTGSFISNGTASSTSISIVSSASTGTASSTLTSTASSISTGTASRISTSTASFSSSASASSSHTESHTIRPSSRRPRSRSHTSTSSRTQLIHATTTQPVAPSPTDMEDAGTSTTRTPTTRPSTTRISTTRPSTTHYSTTLSSTTHTSTTTTSNARLGAAKANYYRFRY